MYAWPISFSSYTSYHCHDIIEILWHKTTTNKQSRCEQNYACRNWCALVFAGVRRCAPVWAGVRRCAPVCAVVRRCAPVCAGARRHAPVRWCARVCWCACLSVRGVQPTWVVSNSICPACWRVGHVMQYCHNPIWEQLREDVTSHSPREKEQ